MKASDVLILRQEIESLLVKRQFAKAATLIKSSKIEDIPYDLRYHFANQARRLGLHKLSLKFLWNNIYEHNRYNEHDLVEYAGSLRKSGLFQQTHRVLEQLPRDNDYFKTKALCYINQWKYKEAIEELEQVDQSQLNEVQQAVVAVNKAISYVEIHEFHNAEACVKPLLDGNIKDMNYNLFLNCLEVMGQVHFYNKDHRKAEEVLSFALGKIKVKTDHTYLFIKMWHLINALEQKILDPHDNEITQFQSEVIKIQHWETLRHFQMYLSYYRKDFDSFKKVFFGTPFESFKNGMSRLMPIEDQKYHWRDERHKTLPFQNIDLQICNLKSLSFGLAAHRLLLMLASDFYRPWSAPRIFDALFADENYNPYTSNKRVQQLIKTVRTTLDKNQIQHQLDSTKNGYRLRPLEGSSFTVYRKMQFSSIEELVTNVIGVHFGRAQFKRSDLQSLLPLSEDKSLRLLKSLQEQSMLDSTGVSKGMLYQLKAS